MPITHTQSSTRAFLLLVSLSYSHARSTLAAQRQRNPLPTIALLKPGIRGPCPSASLKTHAPELVRITRANAIQLGQSAASSSPISISGLSHLFRRGNPIQSGRRKFLRRASEGAADPPIRIGWDIHRMEENGLPLTIGGIEVPFEKGTVAHSDGDVLYHSLTDAILGAIGMPDIGQLFPDNDPRWKGAASHVFMSEAHRLMTERGYQIGNVDITLILQKPKVKDIKPAMAENIVKLLKTHPSRVNIKARTHENVDSVGEVRALACHAVVLLEKV
eukprot:CAMPEP_0114517874 /NCGR_PEP_ID=MMETSP0109-20121206/18137_1 /TAXON_ID=29199 /ORGANISM="Chlorarachnion reptans, Strain CCCM449" /LENGTH=274 /DNA_ID=CAMNT_0001698445 /DNA_START=97 /DNA_END=921 /DNA_ORIENTATION=-